MGRGAEVGPVLLVNLFPHFRQLAFEFADEAFGDVEEVGVFHLQRAIDGIGLELAVARSKQFGIDLLTERGEAGKGVLVVV